jgi:hypothetical protein
MATRTARLIGAILKFRRAVRALAVPTTFLFDAMTFPRYRSRRRRSSLILIADDVRQA